MLQSFGIIGYDAFIGTTEIGWAGIEIDAIGGVAVADVRCDVVPVAGNSKIDAVGVVVDNIVSNIIVSRPEDPDTDILIRYDDVVRNVIITTSIGRTAANDYSVLVVDEGVVYHIVITGPLEVVPTCSQPDAAAVTNDVIRNSIIAGFPKGYPTSVDNGIVFNDIIIAIFIQANRPPVKTVVTITDDLVVIRFLQEDTIFIGGAGIVGDEVVGSSPYIDIPVVVDNFSVVRFTAQMDLTIIILENGIRGMAEKDLDGVVKTGDIVGISDIYPVVDLLSRYVLYPAMAGISHIQTIVMV